MALIVSKQVKIDEYFASERLSQSTLKKLSDGFAKFVASEQKEEDGKENQSFIIGSAVDCILTGEEGEFERQYYVSQLESKPSEAEMEIIKLTLEKNIELEKIFEKDLKELPSLEESSKLIEAIKELNWYKGNPGEKRIAGLVERGSQYYQDLINSLGKTVITTQDDHKISTIVQNLTSHFRTKEYFDRSLYVENSNVDIYYQLPIYFEMQGVKCKSLLDMLLVFRNPDTHKIESVQPVDLKTMQGNTIDFIWSVKRFRYDIQAAFYTEAIKSFIHSEFGLFATDYVLKPFKFVVESTSTPGNPLVYTMSEEFMEIGKYGRNAVPLLDLMTVNSNLHKNITLSKEVRGFQSLLEEYKYYSENEWKEDRRITEGNGVLKLDWDGINL